MKNIGVNSPKYNEDLNTNINVKAQKIREEKINSRVQDLARQFNTKSIEPKNMELKINGVTYKANPETSNRVPVFRGVTDNNVVAYFKELTGMISCHYLKQ